MSSICYITLKCHLLIITLNLFLFPHYHSIFYMTLQYGTRDKYIHTRRDHPSRNSELRFFHHASNQMVSLLRVSCWMDAIIFLYLV